MSERRQNYTPMWLTTFLVLLLLGYIILSEFVTFSEVNDLQRRVGQLEQRQ